MIKTLYFGLYPVEYVHFFVGEVPHYNDTKLCIQYYYYTREIERCKV